MRKRSLLPVFPGLLVLSAFLSCSDTASRVTPVTAQPAPVAAQPKSDAAQPKSDAAHATSSVEQTAATTPTGFAVVELFTSEG